ncbi:hypothetical protein BH23GEM9_BH23GEM9_17510 [soil metagenome]
MTAPVPADRPTTEEIVARRPIVFWGPKNSGKTTYLARMLLRPDELDEAAEWQVTPADERTADYTADILETLRSHGSVKPTLVTERPFWFKLQRRRRVLVLQHTSEWDLVVLDPKGEVFLRNRLRDSDDQMVLRLVARAHGIMLLVDPTAPNAASSYWEMFADNIHEFVSAMKSSDERARTLDGMNRILVPTAICLTKMDNYPDHNDALAFLRTRLGAAYDLIHRSFVTYRVFSCSALGAAGDGVTGAASSDGAAGTGVVSGSATGSTGAGVGGATGNGSMGSTSDDGSTGGGSPGDEFTDAGTRRGEGAAARRPWGLLPPLKWLTEAQRRRFPF